MWVSTFGQSSRALGYPVSFFVRGDEYYVLALFATNLHLCGVVGEKAHVFLFGTNKLGRDPARRRAGGQIVRRHLLPSFLSYLIVSLTLSTPAMILGETALSFLGIGIQPPALSWGALLQSAQNVRSVALAPWLFIPGLFIVATVLAYNFVGDGLRDAADPYT